MNGHRTARALVVDDNETEGVAFLRALSSLSIGALYLTGEESAQELPKLTGIRLLAVDMDLNTGQTETKAMLAKTLKLVRTVLARNNGPFVLIAWTEKDEEVVRDFESLLIKKRADLRPCLVLRIKKSEVELHEEHGVGQIAKKFNISEIRKVIMAKIAEWWPLDLILEWEQIVHDAASDTTTSLEQIVRCAADTKTIAGGDWAQQWKNSFVDVLDTLARAGGGQGIRPEDAFKHLIEVLNPLHYDCVEHSFNLGPQSAPVKSAARLLRSSPPQKMDFEKRAKLNRMLLVANTDSDDISLCPGNIYTNKPKYGKTLFNKCGISKEMIFEDLSVDFAKYNVEIEAIRKLLNVETNKPARERQQTEITRLKSQLDAKEIPVRNKCIPVLVEVTASCDYAQLNQKSARLVAGMLLPSGDMVSTATPSRRKLEAIYLEDKKRGLKGTYTLVLSAHYIFGVPKNSFSAMPVARLRKAVLVDIQSWLASQVARPGYISIQDITKVLPQLAPAITSLQTTPVSELQAPTKQVV